MKLIMQFISLNEALQAWYSKEYSRERSEWSGLPRKSACIINDGDGQSVREFVKKYGESIISRKIVSTLLKRDTMKAKLILLAEPILVVSKEEADLNDFIWTTNIPFEKVKEIDKNYSTQKGHEWLFTVHGSRNQYKSCEVKGKIIAGIPELPSIDFSALSEEDCKKIGWVDVEKLANESFPVSIFDDLFEEGGRIGFKEGFKACQSLNEKKFSEEDMLKLAIYMCSNEAILKEEFEGKGLEEIAKEYIQSVSQPKEVDVEVEMELVLTNEIDAAADFELFLNTEQPKITNNSIKVIKVL